MLLFDLVKSRFSDDKITHVVSIATIESLAFGGDSGTCRVTALGYVMTQCRESAHDYVITRIIIFSILRVGDSIQEVNNS